ncbi:helix-turn-helix domain-containing protein [Aureimonas glaciei]|uniref:AraC family transcriptional regulator n=1 Tax=Aureimonas glaciei TaxID=1776957 RepID=A0A916Y2C3_9HYPH|nr:helix-turn-helix domain-containing protein [Aureimonas glaciei]GGD28094.1 AraC family transcriptional regulator [Aureimonas glaciei]
MFAVPISIVVSLALSFVLVRMRLRGSLAPPLAVLLGACILQGVVNALAQYYGLPVFRLVQPVTAVCVAPVAWLALRSAQGRGGAPSAGLLHLLAPAFVAFCIARAPEAIDAAVIAVFACYGAAMLLALRSGADGLPEARLDAGDWPPLVWRAIAATLIFSAVSDAAISLAVVSGEGWLKSWIIGFGSSLTLLLVGTLASLPALGRAPGIVDATAAPAAAEAAAESDAERGRDAAIMADLERLLDGQRLHRDSELTLSRLARRLGLPAKRVSEAINRQTGENVSRYVNGFRVADACQAIDAGRSVTDAMLGSGFATKSNFNREFRRVTGMAPAQWAVSPRMLRPAELTPPAPPESIAGPQAT